MDFNKEQKEVINYINGALQVIASAGSGKSTTLIQRVYDLVNVHNVSEEDILCISFTKNSSEELKKKLTNKDLSEVNVGTFHSIALRLLLRYNGFDSTYKNLITEWKVEKELYQVHKDMDITEEFKLDQILLAINMQKCYMRGVDDEYVITDINETHLRAYYHAYEELKQKEKSYDFNDWLLHCIDLLDKKSSFKGYEYLLVDEVQDSNLLQHRFMKTLCKNGNIMVVGDISQSIYGFNGGVPSMFMDFDKKWDNVKVINLNTNYRSCKNIVENANKFIKQYYSDYRYYKDAMSSNTKNGKITLYDNYSVEEETEVVIKEINKIIKSKESLNEIAVLYRNNAQSANIEMELKSLDIPYTISGGSSLFDYKEIKCIHGILRLIQDTSDDFAMELIIDNKLGSFMYLNSSVISNIKKYSASNNVSLFQSLTECRYDKPWMSKNMDSFCRDILKLKSQYDKGVSMDTYLNNIIKLFQIKEKILESKYEDKEVRLNAIELIITKCKNKSLADTIDFIGSSKKKVEKKVKSEENIKLMTIHASKGLEFNNVFLIGQCDRVMMAKTDTEDDVLQNVNLFYVAITRPKTNLYISQIGYSTFIQQLGLE